MYTTIAEIGAEGGQVFFKEADKKEKVYMSVQEAAERASAINEMNNPKGMHYKSNDKLIKRIIDACRTAKKQRDTPKNAEENYITNLVDGKDEKGNLKTSNSKALDMDMRFYKEKYLYVDENDIYALLKQNVPYKQMDQMLDIVNSQNRIDHVKSHGGSIG